MSFFSNNDFFRLCFIVFRHVFVEFLVPALLCPPVVLIKASSKGPGRDQQVSQEQSLWARKELVSVILKPRKKLVLCFVIDHLTLSLQSYILAGNCTEEVWMSERAAMAFLTFFNGTKEFEIKYSFCFGKFQ